MRKKVIAMVLALAMTAVALTGCGGGSGDSGSAGGSASSTGGGSSDSSGGGLEQQRLKALPLKSALLVVRL